MSEDIAKNIEFTPIIAGLIISLIFTVISLLVGGLWNMLGVIIGSGISGFSTQNSTIYALIYGAIIAIISSFLY